MYNNFERVKTTVNMFTHIGKAYDDAFIIEGDRGHRTSRRRKGRRVDIN